MGRLVGNPPDSRGSETELPRNARVSLDAFRDSEEFKSSLAAPVVDSSAWHDALQAADTYLEPAGEIKSGKSNVTQKQQVRTLFETLVEDTGRQTSVKERVRQSVEEVHKVKKWLADVNKSNLPASDSFDLRSVSNFSLDSLEFEGEEGTSPAVSGVLKSVKRRVGGNESMRPAISPQLRERERLSPQSSESEEDCVQDDIKEGVVVSKSQQWEEVLKSMRSRAEVQFGFGKDPRRSGASSTTSSSDSMSDEAISERAAVWGDGVAKIVLRNSSRQSTPRTSAESTRSSSHDIPRVSKHVKDALSSVQLAFLVCDVVDPEGPILYASAGFFKMTGYSPEEVIGKNCRFLQGVNTSAKEVARIRQSLLTGKGYTGTLLNYKKDGTPFWNVLTLSPIKDDKGKVIKYIGMQAEAKSNVVTDDGKELASFNNVPRTKITLSESAVSPPSDPPVLLQSKRFDRNNSIPIFSLPAEVSTYSLGKPRERRSVENSVNAARSRSMECGSNLPRRGRETSTRGRSLSIDYRELEFGARPATLQHAVRRSPSCLDLRACERVLEDDEVVVHTSEKAGLKTKIGRLGRKLGLLQLFKNLDRKCPGRHEASIPLQANGFESNTESEIQDCSRSYSTAAASWPAQKEYRTVNSTWGSSSDSDRQPWQSDAKLSQANDMFETETGSPGWTTYLGRYSTNASDGSSRRQFCMVET